MLRRPPDRAALHFYAICLLFFLMYSTSYTGKLNLADWTLLWTDTSRSCSCPSSSCTSASPSPSGGCPRRAPGSIPAAYMPALALAGAAVASQVLFVTTPRAEALLWRITAAIDRWKPLYFARALRASPSRSCSTPTAARAA